MTNFNIIATFDYNFNIGNDGKLPWDIPEISRYIFTITTMNEREYKVHSVLIMGYKTWMNTTKYHNRNYIIISKNGGSNNHGRNDVLFATDFKEALSLSDEKHNGSPIFVVGGSSVFKDALSPSMIRSVKKCYLFVIQKKYRGNIKFPIELLQYMYLDYSQEYITDTGIKISKVVYKVYDSTCKLVHPEHQYISRLRKILLEGYDVNDRTGTGIRTIFGMPAMVFNLEYGFPLITTKNVKFDTVLRELLWFISGSTDVKKLQKHGIKIWNGNSSREFLDNRGLTDLDEHDIGASYGFQFRFSGADYKTKTGGVDQLQNVINIIKNNPNSRRIMINLWNPSQLSAMAIPPCLFNYHFRIIDNRLNCAITQRSGDMGLGVPFNIASASILIHILAHICDLRVGNLIHTVNDAHVYHNHLLPLANQLDRNPLPFPRLEITCDRKDNVDDYTFNDFKLHGYVHYPFIKMKMAI
jgi:dihydrofolate reductase/thymidylate synthase